METIETQKADHGFQEGNGEMLKRTFTEILTGNQERDNAEREEDDVVKIIQTPPPQVGGNITVTIDEGEYIKGVQEHQFNVIGRLSIRQGESYLSTMGLRKKLEVVWGISNFRMMN